MLPVLINHNKIMAHRFRTLSCMQRIDRLKEGGASHTICQTWLEVHSDVPLSCRFTKGVAVVTWVAGRDVGRLFVADVVQEKSVRRSKHHASKKRWASHGGFGPAMFWKQVPIAILYHRKACKAVLRTFPTPLPLISYPNNHAENPAPIWQPQSWSWKSNRN